MRALLVLGNQLFPQKYLGNYRDGPIFMAEDYGLCTHYRYHKLKIAFFLSAMRHYRGELEGAGFKVCYHALKKGDQSSYEEKLQDFVRGKGVKELHCFEVEDSFFAARLQRFCEDEQVKLHIIPSPMFLSSRQQFEDYLAGVKKPFMKSFYEQQRRRLDVLMESDGRPSGGKFSFDSDNRKKLPPTYRATKPALNQLDQIDQDVSRMVEQLFADHPGKLDFFWVPTTRKAALKLWQNFLKNKFADFGPYQDAISSKNSFLNHSLISTALNTGLLVPEEIVADILRYGERHEIPIESVEGLLRQIIGWREFVRGIYHNFDGQMTTTNFWNSHRKLKPCWYDGTTGIPPLDDAIKNVLATGYSHHIERLMVLANIMNLCEIEPRVVYRWFMEMYADSSDWVMAANVYGMGLMSDGGIFATKPYISGSNYILKMSDYKKGPWCQIWDGLYWRFVEKHFDFFDRNPRMRMMTRTLIAMDPGRKVDIFSAAENFLAEVTSK